MDRCGRRGRAGRRRGLPVRRPRDRRRAGAAADRTPGRSGGHRTSDPPSHGAPAVPGAADHIDLPLNCTEIPPPYLVFEGRITAYQVPTFRFKVDKVIAGTWAGPLIDVDFVDDAGFMRIGPTYLVAAQVDPATGKLYSKLRTSFRTQPGPGTCPATTRSSPAWPTGRPSTPDCSRG